MCIRDRAYVPGPHMLDTEIIVIKEYRSPCRNQSGFVYELPGGSSFKPNTDVYQTAADELFEETVRPIPALVPASAASRHVEQKCFEE